MTDVQIYAFARALYSLPTSQPDQYTGYALETPNTIAATSVGSDLYAINRKHLVIVATHKLTYVRFRGGLNSAHRAQDRKSYLNW